MGNPRWPQYRHIDVGVLVAGAGGDPWEIDASLAAGRPAQISALAEAFYGAGICTGQTQAEWIAATQKFYQAWVSPHRPDHPIVDSPEVQLVGEQLNLQREKLAAIAVDLQHIAGSLAQAQDRSRETITGLEQDLREIDEAVDAALAELDATPATVDLSHIVQVGTAQTALALARVRGIRAGYVGDLDRAMDEMVAEGYTPGLIDAFDGDGSSAVEQARVAADSYDAKHRAADHALVDTPGPMTPDKAAAAARLRDWATIANPYTDPDAARYAGQRLDDYLMSRFVGPLPTDPVLGGDARSRATWRLDMQRQFEHGVNGHAPMTPDAVTTMLNQAEAQARILAPERLLGQLREVGVSPEGARNVVENLNNLAGHAGGGLGQYAESVPTGKHALDGLSKADAAALSKIGQSAIRVTTVVSLGMAIEEWLQGGPNRNEELGGAVGQVAGGAAGGMVAGMVVGSVAGPVTAAGGAIVGAIVGGAFGEQVGGAIGSTFDPGITADGRAW